MKTVKCHRCGKELVTDDYNTDGKAYYCQWCAPIARQEEWNAQHGCKSITTDKDGNIVRKYRDGSTTVHTPKQVKRSFLANYYNPDPFSGGSVCGNKVLFLF